MNLKDAAHIAKLAHFGIEVTAAIDEQIEQQPIIANLVQRIAAQNNVRLPVSLRNQSAFLGQLYITLLWAREAVGNKDQQRFNSALGRWFDHTDHSRVDIQACVGRDLTDIDQFVRTIRNALGHASIELVEGRAAQMSFEFSDGRERQRATIRMPAWAVGELADAATLAISFMAYGSPRPPARKP